MVILFIIIINQNFDLGLVTPGRNRYRYSLPPVRTVCPCDMLGVHLHLALRTSRRSNQLPLPYIFNEIQFSDQNNNRNFHFHCLRKKKESQTKTKKIKVKIFPDNTQEKFPKPQYLLSQLYKNTEELFGVGRKRKLSS